MPVSTWPLIGSGGGLRPLLFLPLSLFALLTPADAQPVPPEVVWERDAAARTVVFSPDGQYVVSGGIRNFNPYTYGRVDVFAAADGALVAHAESHAATPILGRTNGLALSPDGQTLASANGGVHCQAHGGCYAERPGLFTWTFPDLNPLVGRIDLTPADALDYAPDGSALAVAYFYDNQGLVRIHDADPLTVERVLVGHGTEADDVEYSPDGTRLASVGHALLSEGTLKVWDPATGALVYAVQHGSLTDGGVPTSVAYSPDGTRIATAGDGYDLRAKVWDAATGALLLDLDAQIVPDSYGSAATVAFTPNGAYLVGGLSQYVSGSGSVGLIRFWDATTGEVVMEYSDAGPPPYYGGIAALAFTEAENHRFAYAVGGVVKVAETDLNLSDTESTAVTVAITPRRRAVTIPPSGGTIAYGVTLTNATAQPRTVEVWVTATAPDGVPFGRVQGPHTVALGANETVGPLSFARRISASAPSGTYTVTAHVGGYPSDVEASDSFTFMKRAASVAASALAAEGAYPNPFAGRTTIRFTTDEAAEVRLTVYDALGREVAVLVDRPVPAGSHAVPFDGTSLPNGVYGWRLEAAGRATSGRLTLLR